MQSTYAEQYRGLYQQHWWWRARERFVLSHIERLPHSSWTDILDIGCGDGLFFPQLSRFGRVRGVEPDASLLSADAPHREQIEVCPFGPAYRSPRRYDLVLMLDVLEHIEDDGGALAAAGNLLKPGGYLLMTVPALPALWSRHDTVNLHYRRYTRDSLTAVARSSGLRVDQMQYFFGWTVLPLLVRRWLHPPTQGHDGAYAVSLPRPAVSRRLQGLCRFEQRLFGDRGCPVGSSLFALLRK